MSLCAVRLCIAAPFRQSSDGHFLPHFGRMGFALQFLDLYGLAPNSSRADMAAALASHGPMLLPNCYQPPAHPFCRGEGNDAALDLTTLARIEDRRVSDDSARVGPKPGRCGAEQIGGIAIRPEVGRTEERKIWASRMIPRRRSSPWTPVAPGGYRDRQPGWTPDI